MRKQRARELTIYANRQRVYQYVGCVERHVVVSAYAVGMHDVGVGEDGGWRAGDHGCADAGGVAVAQDVEGGVGGADDGDGLGGGV